MSDLRPRLDRLVPDLPREGDWERVLADAQRPRSVRLLGFALPPVAAAAAIAAVLALAWPFGSDRSGGVLDLALAAMGEGPVVHVVYRGDWGPTLVHLTTGEVKPFIAEHEVWFDPDRGVKSVSRIGGDVVSEHVVPPNQVAARQEQQLLALADRYRAALQNKKARLIGPGTVRGRRVLWIRVRSEWLPDGADGRNHLFAEEVAVDPKSYEPVYARFTRDGRPPPGGGGSEIVELERVAADEVDFDTPEKRLRLPLYAGAETVRPLRRSELAQLFGDPAIWLGPSYRGMPLVQAQAMAFKDKERKEDPWRTTPGATFFYGELHPRRGGYRMRDERKPHVLLTEAKEVAPMWQVGAGGSRVPDGWLRFDRVGAAFLRMGNVYVSINAKSTRAVLAAATALRAYGAPAPPPSGLDLDRIAREVDARDAHRIEVTGGKPVKPRPLVARRGRLAQSAEANGVIVRIFSGGIAQFDLQAMDQSRRRAAPRLLRSHCFRIKGGRYSGGGGYGSVPRGGIKAVPLFGHSRGRPPVLLKPPFAGCELGTGFGRNWLKRFDFHGMFELPLTESGRRYFDERAAARELAYFVRSGSRRAARRAMRAGEQAPPAERLLDRSSPHITVTSSGDRFTAVLRASTGRRFFVEIVRGSIRRTNARELAHAYLK